MERDIEVRKENFNKWIGKATNTFSQNSVILQNVSRAQKREKKKKKTCSRNWDIYEQKKGHIPPLMSFMAFSFLSFVEKK